jgi:guanylate kinase
MKGPLIILSGPSGSGKSTVVARLLQWPGLRLRLAVSATTRPPRPGEVNGRHYHFWTAEQFDRAVAAGEFLEWAEVFGHRYGTLRREVEPYREQGWEVYEQRLRQRGTEDEEALRRRVAGARQELARAGEYDYQVINDDLETAVAELATLIRRRFEEGGNHA